MADPFSILAGTAGLTDVCVRLAQFLKHANDGFRVVDQELQALSEEIESLHSVNELIERSHTEGSTAKANTEHQKILGTNWRATQKTLSSCQHIVENIERILIEVDGSGSGKHIKRDQLRKWLKQQKKEEELSSLREKLKAHQNALQLSLSAVNIIYSRTSQQASHKSHSELSQSLQNLGDNLELKIDSLERIMKSSSERISDSVIVSAQRAVYLNKHFFTPQAVSSIYTGRGSELDLLEERLVSEGASLVQKRFIIYGLAGSGKTQFCCKFASKNKESFWGVFWVNATSKEHAEQSFSTISTIGKVAPNQAAVKSWFSSLGPQQPWLLIIDNADDKDFPVQECFPDSTFGTILITTRNPMLRTHGTVEPRSFEFNGLDDKKSIELLLSASGESKPWKPTDVEFASVIAKAMGHLPLALIHAGATVLAGLCTLETYLDFFEATWNRIRQIKEPNSTTPISDTNAAIYSSFELIHEVILTRKTSASQDALELLKIFSFLDRQQIKLDIFLRAAANPVLEHAAESRKEGDRMMYSNSIPRLTRAQTLRNAIMRLGNLLFQLGHRPVLPKFLCQQAGAEPFSELRLREGLKELSQMSLISTNSGQGDCYSMHAAVHLWARQRPNMTLAEQAVWCQITATILSQSILLPPLGDTEEDEIFRRDLLPHVRHIQHVERAIQSVFAQNRESRRRLLPALQPRVTPDQLVQLVKFSLVYAQGHQLEEAERLQSYVANIAFQYLGVENMKTINIMRLLSWTYWQLARPDKAVELQKQALQACIKVLGPENPETLQIMDSYGSSLWLQGHVPEARKLHTTAVEGLKKVLGEDDVQTLKAMGGLGRAVGKDFDFAEAIDIQTKAFIGLRAKLGSSHTATLEAMDNLAMAYFDRAAYRQGRPKDLERALELESEVFTTRAERLGREHYHTLWAGLNLARIKAVCGETDEALSIFLPGHSVVRRDLGEEHFIYLFGELHHGRILMCAKRYDEAERILTSVVDSHEKNRGQHPDRLLAMFSLIKCRNVLDKSNQTSTLLEELISGTKALFGTDHAAVRYIIDGQVLSKDASEILLDHSTKREGTNIAHRVTGYHQHERRSSSSVMGERIQPILMEEKKREVFGENELRSREGKESLKGKNRVRDDDDK